MLKQNMGGPKMTAPEIDSIATKWCKSMKNTSTIRSTGAADDTSKRTKAIRTPRICLKWKKPFQSQEQPWDHADRIVSQRALNARPGIRIGAHIATHPHITAIKNHRQGGYLAEKVFDMKMSLVAEAHHVFSQRYCTNRL
mmetsp:Transcript_54954/g.103106  ORF Transcript_54954/g.103106 Transcript_54954/m.103106 type:complete len:140 (-) Transcript_54954:26-445(-)